MFSYNYILNKDQKHNVVFLTVHIKCTYDFIWNTSCSGIKTSQGFDLIIYFGKDSFITDGNLLNQLMDFFFVMLPG